MKVIKRIVLPIFLLCVILIPTIIPVWSAEIQSLYAKASDDLLNVFSKIGNNTTTSVIVWLEDNVTESYKNASTSVSVPDGIINDSSNEELHTSSLSEDSDYSEDIKFAQIAKIQEYIMQKRQLAQSIYTKSNNIVANELSKIGKVTYVSKYSPLIVCNVTRSEAAKIATNNNVQKITNGNIKGENCMNLAPTITGTSTLHSSGYTGQGIILGMIEGTVPDINSAAFSGISKNKIITHEDQGVGAKTHATSVAAIMINKNYGSAKGFERLYCASCDNNSTMIERIEWLLDQGVNVINVSWGMQNYPNGIDESTVTPSLFLNNDYGEWSKWIDHIAYNHSVHIVTSSGNYGSNRVSNNAMAYNAITVGATNDNDTSAYGDDILASRTTDFPYRSSYNNLGNLPYKPDLCAPGQSVLISNVSSQPFFGTSFAAPQVAGIVASLCSKDPSLLLAQDQMKAILTCSTVKAKHNYNTLDAGFRQYGAGTVNAKNAMLLMNAGTYQGGSITASESRDFISLGTIPAGKAVTVSLTFLKRVRFLGSDHITSPTILESNLPDLDIYIAPVIAMPIPYAKSTYIADQSSSSPIYNYIHRSISNCNNVEKVTFTTTSTTEYILTINKEASYDSYEILYGVAWQIHNSNIS